MILIAAFSGIDRESQARHRAQHSSENSPINLLEGHVPHCNFEFLRLAPFFLKHKLS